MNARELLEGWPSFADRDARELLASPAWRMFVDIGDGEGVLTRTEIAADELLLKITLDERPCVLGLADSAAFPDLHLLWARRGELPDVVVLALVEKEAGRVLEAVERLVRKELRLVGVASEGEKAQRTAFRLEGAGAVFGFSLVLSPEIEGRLGVRANLDPDHETVRSLARAARVCYAAVEVPEGDLASVAPGDLLLADTGSPRWITDLPADEALYVCSSDETSLTFARLADDDLPPLPAPGALTLFRRGRPFAAAEMSSVGDAAAVRVVTLFKPTES